MNAVAALATRFVVWVADPTPSPYPAYTGDANLITPGVVGFAVTFFVAAATVLLLVDMSRRMRRARYRSAVREQLDAEREASGEAEKASPADSSPR